MGISQISVFAESKPGHLARILSAFEAADINVRGFSASDTGDFGIIRFILDNPEKGLEVLKEMGAAATETEILCAKLDDTPGELARVMKIISDAKINISYSYSLISTYIALHPVDIDAAEKALVGQPVVLIEQSDLA